MPFSNFHTHSNYCDGKASLRESVNKARALGLLALGFTSHAPIPMDCKWCMKPALLDGYLKEIEQLKDLSNSPQIYSSLEIDYIPGLISPNDFASKLDYTIGSVHFVDFFGDGRAWEIDSTHASFLEGYENIFKKDIKAVISRYYELIREMVATASPSIVGHLDRIKIQNVNESFYKESDGWYQDQVKLTLDEIKKSGAIVEVNTKGLYQKKCATTYPSPWMLELIFQKEIPITLSSDAHHPDDLINLFPEVASVLRAQGFKTIRVLWNDEWIDAPFDHEGIRV